MAEQNAALPATAGGTTDSGADAASAEDRLDQVIVDSEKKKIAGQIRMKKRIRRAKNVATSYGASIFVIFLIFSSIGLYFLRTTILTSTDSLGSEIVTRFDSKVKELIDREIESLKLIAHYADSTLQGTDTTQYSPEFQNWLNQSKSIFSSNQAVFAFDLYAFIDDHVYSTMDVDYRRSTIKDREWYQRVLIHGGDVVVIEPSGGSGDNNRAITIVTSIGNTDNILVCDLFPPQHSMPSVRKDLPTDYNFYLFDRKGNLILYYDQDDTPHRVLQQFLHSHYRTMIDTYSDDTTIFTDHAGREYAYYMTFNDTNGWYSMATTPYERLLATYHRITNLFILMIAIFLIFEAWMLYREYHLSAQIETTNEALKVLGNSYQAIIRVNFKLGTFSILRAPDDWRQSLSGHTDFQYLKDTLTRLIHTEHLDDFVENYSLSNMEHLMVNRIRDMGHDFLIKTGDKYSWYNVRILFDESLDLDESILAFKIVDEDKSREILERDLLKNAIKMAKDNENAKNLFFSSMSHDMRTPLNGIIGICTLCRTHTEEPDKVSEYLDKITASSRVLLHIVDDILEVARPDVAQNLDLAPCNLRDSLENDLSVFALQAEQNGKTFTLSIDIVHDHIICDIQKLRQILNNLISNSLKYSDHGATIDCIVREMNVLEKEQFVFEVKDTGIGMSEEYLEVVFEPYTREQSKKGVQGTGLGMPNVKNLVGLMNGDIKIVSKKGVGTDITVTLPLEIDQSHAAAAAEAKVTTLIDMRGLNLLVAEDNALNMEIVTDILEMKEVSVTQAWNGREAVEAFEKSEPNQFDAILMDVRMPIMDGCEATMALRKLERPDARTIPIIACTANAFSEDISSTQAAGMNAHVSKPIDFDILTETLSKLLLKDPRYRDRLVQTGDDASAAADQAAELAAAEEAAAAAERMAADIIAEADHDPLAGPVAAAAGGDARSGGNSNTEEHSHLKEA